MVRERRVYRRWETQVLVLFGLWVVAMAVVLALGGADEAMLAVTIVGPVGPILYLFGPSVSVVVTPHEIVVNNTFHRWRIARSLLTPPELDDTFLEPRGHGLVDVAALQTAFDGRTVAAAVRWFRAATAEVAALPDDGRRRLGVRWLNVTVLAVAIGGWVLSERYIP
ncbi:hypothetical protein AMIS_49030 [Actinoplanes missouriensis 431]|uniref:Uncharacterized protein n=1 Tax=Actinoplanes missouriensis (strain ATCC 14538 / DSM 43046 / CBS 188.64 / JCM 3121 / NBRC 102363 / NCIMB 12654 / NRRL B-3342 / UNCC 431) TaxID=512565 RepID=I0HAT6_ACTM4|nr:hypothetical protein [Actinoplanes missouriensis]BAL90123.1 hypothetical protein AMIS_49030 [Actinoplanes missouriensis 431]